jgi:hypothetical protein
VFQLNIVKITSRDKLNKILKKLSDDISRAEFLVASEIIKRKDLPEDAVVLNYGFLIPSPALITIYSVEGRKHSEYDKDYLRYLSHPANMYFINEALMNASEYDLDVFLICALDEEEYGYIEMTGDFIESLYGIKVLSSKKYLNGKQCKIDNENLYSRCKSFKTKLRVKMEDSHLNPEAMFKGMIFKKDLKKMKKKG